MNTVTINPEQVNRHGYKMDPNLSILYYPPNPATLKTPKKGKHIFTKMSGQRIIGSSDLFLLDSCQDNLKLDSNLNMTGIIVGIPGKYSCCWTLSWDSNIMGSKILNKYHCTVVMHSNSKMTECLFLLVTSSTDFIQIQNTDDD